jgi:hypothetical protein
LRRLFKERGVSGSFSGALTFSLSDLFMFSEDLILYPCAVFDDQDSLYKDLDISHSNLQFIIKVSSHMCVDFLSTNKHILRELIEENSGGLFNITEYRSNPIWGDDGI